jgi:putative ABC transport system permease protein
MFRNFLAAAIRHLARNRVYAAISVLGLAVGLWAALLEGLVLRNQFGYDHFIPGYQRIYVAMSFVTPPGHGTVYLSSTNNFVAPILKSRFSEIESVTRLMTQPVTLRHDNVEAREQIYWADPNAFEVLPLPVVAGDLKAALRRPDSIVLSRSVARKYFGRDAPLGETLTLDGQHSMTVTAVIENLPLNATHLQNSIFASAVAPWTPLSAQDRIPGNVAGSAPVGFGTNTYLKLTPGASPQRLLAGVSRLAPAIFLRPPPGWSDALQAMPLDRLHTHPGLNPGFAATVIMSMILTAVILLIACINFVNLLTARSTQRAMEVAVRKISGAARHVLIAQFLGESMIYVAIAVLVAAALTEWSLPYVNSFLNSGATFDYWRDYALLGWIALGSLVLGLLAGTYPALVLSAFRPLRVLRGTARRSSPAGFVRQSLVTVQFAILIGLLISAGVVYRQRVYATHEALRLDTDQVLIVRSRCGAVFTQELRKLPGVRGVSCSGAGLLDGPQFFTATGKDGVQQLMFGLDVDAALFRLYGIRPSAGRLTGDPGSNGEDPEAARRYCVINETAARQLGFTTAQDAVGFALPGLDRPGSQVQVIGVVPDFSLTSVEHRTEAIAYRLRSEGGDFGLINIKLTGREIPETLTAIDRLWTATGDGKPIDRFFLEDHLQSLYIAVLREAQTFAVFSFVAMLLACLGLLGFSASITSKRTREIGIRKALGAQTRDIVRLLLWQFTKPVLCANLIAWPAAGFFMNRWLQRFAYHIDIGPELFLAATGVAVVIALLTVTSHTLLVARQQPAFTLRVQ